MDCRLVLFFTSQTTLFSRTVAFFLALKGHKITVETVDLRAPTDPPVSDPTSSPVNLPTLKPILSPTLSPTLSSAPSNVNLMGYGDFEGNSTDTINAAWASSCATTLLDVNSETTNATDIHSGDHSYRVTGGQCSVLRMMGNHCPANRMANLTYGDTIKISLWVKMDEPSQVFQMFTGHYHARKAGRWARPTDDSHVISRTLIDNANKWKYIEATHTVGPDWTFEGEVLAPKYCNHYQLRFNLATSEASYILDDVKVELVSPLSDEEKQVAFLRNPSFVSSHKNWKMSSSSGTNVYDEELGQTVMQLKRGQVLRQVITDTATPGQKYSFGFWVKLDSSKDVTLKVILRMRFQNNDRVYGPCVNPVCNLYERPVRTTISAGSNSWQHVLAEDFEMYGNYNDWDGKVDFILFQVTTQGMPNSGSLRIANFHDLQSGATVPPSLSYVPSYSPTTLMVEDVAYIVRYAGQIRTVVKLPFRIESTGEVLPMDGSVEYVLCDVEEVEGSLSELPKGLGFIVDGKCESIKGGNPTVSTLQ